MNRADVWMVQRRDGTRLTLEALAKLRVRCERGRQHLDRHVAFPGVDSTGGWWVVVGIMAAVLVSLIGFFKYKRWI